MIHFVESTPGGMPRKRKQCARACDACRKRKKRCDHQKPAQGTASSPKALSPASRPIEVEPVASTINSIGQRSDSPSTMRETPRSAEDAGTRPDQYHVGEMNPEATFLAGAAPSRNGGVIDLDKFGIWLSHRPSSCPTHEAKSTYIYSPDSLISKLFLPYLERHCLSLLPSPVDFDVLRAVYFRDIHPVFPVLDSDALDEFPEASPVRSVMAQAICLAASATLQQSNSLRLSSDPDFPLQSNQFAQQLSKAILTTINLGVIDDKSVIIQVLTLLSLSNQLSYDRHFSAELTARAVSHAQTLGLHLYQGSGRKCTTNANRLFCCVWALDRLNSAIHGRPTLIHERDFRKDLELCISQQEPCFRVFLRIVKLLDQTINLYRPGMVESSSDDFMNGEFPDFEEIVYSSEASSVSSRLMATIEILYHAVSILACRTRSSASHVRQSLSASRISTIVRDELSDDIALLPTIPYAVSLSLRVFYRDFRSSKATIFRMRARREILFSCSVLRRLGTKFASAVSMANLAEETVREVDKTPASEPLWPDQETVEAASTPSSINPTLQSRNSMDVVGDAGNESGLMCRQENSENPRAIGVADSIDQMIFETMPDLDIFAHFDRDFELVL